MATPWFSFSGITGGKKDVTSRIIPWCSWRIYTGLSYLPPYWPIHTAFLGFRPILPTYQMIQQLGFPAPTANHPSNQLLAWSDWPILSACLTQQLLGFLAHPAYIPIYNLSIYLIQQPLWFPALAACIHDPTTLGSLALPNTAFMTTSLGSGPSCLHT